MMRTFFSLRVPLRTIHPMHLHWLKMFERFSVRHSWVLSPFPLVFTTSTTTPTPLACATLLCGGPSGHLVDLTPNTGYEPKFCTDVSNEQTPINLPSRKSSFQLGNDATIAAWEDFDLPQHSGASSCPHSVASTVPTLLKLGSSGSSTKKLVADYETIVSCVEESVSRGREIEM